MSCKIKYYEMNIARVS